ncbi:YfiR family protein [Candidatus Venteria ishoeyi]|uniref:DUF4154 domain-containing protein n=1 Tax=Candidatus Venteria ishoeyi TaxID=1899563 RepID=A0A1H6F5M3_9GAMM|nr:YfiR family protein [Candidatus Venteria ishoeyi]MDM8547160.1 YfiR family protein [Candidatus Venteria ishoeyi]SEH04295.1 Uncharacterised protein [Candidatus Venteria ishoeyi]SEH06776.1 Uncharacterised protein [Candidatus Venteria ishoeyi]SEH07843.1 Uncharacterised protein [Candidatus Venteria ishoeyi]
MYKIQVMLLSITLSLLLCNNVGATPPAPRESQVKAVYLNGYSKFIAWPASAFSDKNSPFRICIFGENPFGRSLELAVANETVKNRPVQAMYLNVLEQVSQCQILYVSDSEKIRLNTILDKTRQYPILTVGNLKNFVFKGGMIQFYNHNNHISFMIDPATLREAGLEPNANLLRISEVVKR